MFKIGGIYYFGRGVEQDYGKAFEWYLAASDVGIVVAMLKISNYGRGVEQDENQALSWHRKAQETVEEQSKLTSRIVHHDNSASEHHRITTDWFCNTVRKGSATAKLNIDDMYNYGIDLKQDYHKAREWYLKARDARTDETMSYIGSIFVLLTSASWQVDATDCSLLVDGPRAKMDILYFDFSPSSNSTTTFSPSLTPGMSGNLGKLIKIFAEFFRKHSTSLAFGVSGAALLTSCVQWGVTESGKSGNRVGIAISWPTVPGMWEAEGWGPWKDFYDTDGNKEHNAEDWIKKGGAITTKETLSSGNLLHFNLKQPGKGNVCLSSIVMGFNKDVPTLGGVTVVLDTSVMNYIFVDPHKAYDENGIACIWWGTADRAGDYLNFDAYALKDCKHSYQLDGLQKYIRCVQGAIIHSCTINKGCFNFPQSSRMLATGGPLKPVKIANSYQDLANITSLKAK
ncbi:hypothetical protein BGX28_009917 [Mortierella sp. GBA30]|nr:hypothetical protein BGX28_009917 [Mortierella sp. GBA30]